MENKNKVIVALDFPSENSAVNLVERLDPSICRLKVGKQLFVRAGPALVEKLVNKGFDVFLDLKFYDIPNTVAESCDAAADIGVWMMNVHASGGRKMMETAMNKLEQRSNRPIIIAVTILTSFDKDGLSEVGFTGTALENVLKLAKLTKENGLDGVVSSPLEVSALRSNMDEDFQIITPGIRPVGSDTGDQVRIMTPKEAINTGSDYLVIGRPITAADDPLAALIEINNQIYS